MYQTFGQRMGVQAPFDYHDGVPTHLDGPLWDWVQARLLDGQGRPIAEVDRIIVAQQLSATGSSLWERWETLRSMMRSSDLVFLNVLDHLLRTDDQLSREELEELLARGLSAYQVDIPSGRLEIRLTNQARRMYHDSLSPADRAARHIADAWEQAFRLTPDPGGAWDQATSAVEALLHRIVSPNDAKATLGKMISALRAKPSKWEFDLAENKDAAAIIPVLEMIGYGPGRHGTDHRTATVEQVRAVVQLAVTVVEWLRAGLLRVAT